MRNQSKFQQQIELLYSKLIRGKKVFVAPPGRDYSNNIIVSLECLGLNKIEVDHSIELSGLTDDTKKNTYTGCMLRSLEYVAKV